MATIEKSKTVVTKRRHLKVTGERGRFALNGNIVPIEAIVEVSLHEAIDLVARGLAVDASAEEVAAAGVAVIASSTRFDSWADAA